MRFKSILVLAASLMVNLTVMAQNEKIDITGAGASFPAPAYTKWIYDYSQTVKANVKLNYQSMGSSAGVQQIIEKTVNFGATDDPMSNEELKKYDLLQFPTLMGGIVVIINIPGIKEGDITLSGGTLGDIFCGKITKWNDRKIRKDNPNLRLPNMEINVISRADGSGTTAIFSDYLCKVSPLFKEKVGQGKLLKFPGSGAQKNPGVANLVMQTRGGIGYVESAYATENNLSWIKMINAKGKIVKPNAETFTAAASVAKWLPENNFSVNLTNQIDDNAWPIVAATYIVIHKTQPDAKTKEQMLNYFRWCYEKGSTSAMRLKYIPMPKNVVDLVEKQFELIKY